MMDNNDYFQSRLDRIGQWRIFETDWAHIRELAVMKLADLCALSVGINPRYAEAVDELTTIDPEEPLPENFAEIVAFRNGKVDEWRRRVGVAFNHVAAGTLAVANSNAANREYDPYAVLAGTPVEKTTVKVADFASWADGRGWDLPDEFPRPDREFIGNGWPWGNHETQLLQKLAAAADKFWRLYDPADATTAPTNKQVTDWLKTKGVGQRNAEIMATILRADGLPFGRRK